MADLEERLLSHSKAFEQLLGLIPAKHYFSANDNNAQWNKRKQTKEESQHAKRGKLDPGSIMSAADFGRKRQERELAGGGEDEEQEGEVEWKEVKEPMTRRQKRQKRKELVKESKAARGGRAGKQSINSESKPLNESEQVEDDGGTEEIQLDGFNFSTQLSHPPSPPPPPPQSSNPPQKLKPTMEISPEKRLEQKARLEARIQQLRAKRNADSPDSTPARNRDELMAARRRAEAQARKEKKKEVRLKQKATVEQTKNVAPTPKKNPPKDGQPDGGESPGNAQRNASINLQTHGRDKEKGKAVVKKTNPKRSRPGFEGSLKASKKRKK